MSDAAPLLDRAVLEDVFRKLGDRLARRGVVADIYVIGGAARWPTTRVVPPATSTQSSSPTESCWTRPAPSPGLPPWWLNEQASVYVAPGGDPAAKYVFDHPGLRVSAASPEHLLAMKVLAARRRDAEDIRFLVRHLHLSSVKDVLALCAEVFPEEPVPERAQLVLEDVFETGHGSA